METTSLWSGIAHTETPKHIQAALESTPKPFGLLTEKQK